MKDILIHDRYRVDRKIGEGGFGLVYSGTDIQLDQEVAIKLTKIQEGRRLIQREVETCKALAGGAGIPRVLWFGDDSEYYVTIQELLGPSLEDLFNYCGRKFSLKTILLVAEQLISRLEYIHSKMFVYRDIKPENFLMGTDRHGNIIYAIDFGLAAEFYDDRSYEHLENCPFVGTSYFASINVHKGRAHSRRDDLESVGCMLCYFAYGSLPWQGLEVSLIEERNELLGGKKSSLSGKDICGDALPGEFATFIDYARSLDFDQKPDYAYLRKLLRRRFKSEGFKYDNIFDWTEKVFREMGGQERSRSVDRFVASTEDNMEDPRARSA